MELQFLVGLLGIAGSYLQSLRNKKAETIGADIALIDQATMAVLAENAKIKGLAIDWEDPAAVQGFIATLPTFTPIPEPGAGPTKST